MTWVNLCVWIVISTVFAAQNTSTVAAMAEWNSPCRYRALVSVNPRRTPRTMSPATVDIDPQAIIASLGGKGTFDPDTVEVIAYDSSGKPRVITPSREGYEKYLLPSRIDRYYPISKITVHFVMPDHNCTTYAVYFDTVESGLGKPQRYSGLVGDGDFFREGYKRREINASHFDHFVDFDGDGDLDLFKGGVEPWVYCYENVGGNRFVDRGRLTSGGTLFTLPRSADNRSWVTVAFHDWDGDGDMDFFPSFTDGPDAGKIIFYRNTTPPGGPLTFTRVGPLQTVTGTPIPGGPSAGGWFPSITFVGDWDGDGQDGDIIVGSNNKCWLYRSLGRDANGDPRLADCVAIKAGGEDIVLSTPRFDVADIDNDGDLDLFAGCQPGPIYWFRNVGTRTQPVFAQGVMVAYQTSYYISDAHSGVKVADWDGDGLLDIVVGRFWERTPASEATLPRYFGGLYKNVGTSSEPVFERRDAYSGSPYTERFQICDAVRQNCVRTVDWNNDGKPDLIAGDTDGFVWYFRNTTDRLFPVFATGQKINVGGQPICMMSSGGHARPDIVDWNNDGKKDLVVADGNGWITLFLNTGTDSEPVFTTGTRLYAGGEPIDSPGSRSSVLVCDWNNDGKKDVVQADDDTSSGGYYWYKNIGTDSAPVLAARAKITFGGKSVTYTRPNLGSFVDWDGDGKKDFIGCNFENNVRFYKNIGAGSPNQVPTFAADAEGVTILRDYCIMMISGADVKDWNGDGDLDILTGQGHGGSGLRFFERDYIEDVLNNTLPLCTVTSVERARSISEVKNLDDSVPVVVPGVLVSACYDAFFYVESIDRVSAIRVVQENHGRRVGERVDVRGVVRTTVSGERYIEANSVVLTTS